MKSFVLKLVTPAYNFDYMEEIPVILNGKDKIGSFAIEQTLQGMQGKFSLTQHITGNEMLKLCFSDIDDTLVLQGAIIWRQGDDNMGNNIQRMLVYKHN